MEFIKKYQILFSFLFLVCVLLIFLFICLFNADNPYISKVGDKYYFNLIKENGKIIKVETDFEVDRENISYIKETDAMFLLHSGEYKIVDVSEDFKCVFFKPIFEGEDDYSEDIEIYKSFRKTISGEKDVIVRYIPYMEYSESSFVNVIGKKDYLEQLDNVDKSNFLVYRYSFMQVTSGSITLEKIGLLPEELQPNL